MSAFYVGQRVRIIATGTPRRGCEARIIGFVENSFRVACGIFIDAYHCDVVGWGAYDPEDGISFAYAASELEPIIPEGMKPARWEDCVWQPEGVSA